MGFLLDDASTRGAGLQQQVQNLIDWSQRCTRELNQAMNSISTKNMAQPEAKALMAAMADGGLEQKLRDMTVLLDSITSRLQNVEDQIDDIYQQIIDLR